MSQYQKKTFTNSHLSWSSIILYLHPPSFTIHGFLLQFPCLTVFLHNVTKFSLIYLLAWHPPLHTPSISSPNHCLLFAAHAHIIATCFAVVPKLCHLILVSQPFIWNSILWLNATHPSDHSHLCLLKCHLIFLFYGPGLTSMQHTTSHTAAV